MVDATETDDYGEEAEDVIGKTGNVDTESETNVTSDLADQGRSDESAATNLCEESAEESPPSTDEASGESEVQDQHCIRPTPEPKLSAEMAEEVVKECNERLRILEHRVWCLKNGKNPAGEY